MPNKTISSVTLACLLIASSALACDYPERPDVVDGASASRDQMIATQKAVKDFQAAMETYLGCIDKEEKAAVAALGEVDEDTLKQRTVVFNKRYNAAVDELNLVAAEFNEQVRAYKENNAE